MDLDSFLDLAERSLSTGAQKKVLHLYHEGEEFSGRTVELSGQILLNFGSCSYLGLEKHPALIDACCEAARKFGTQLSSSRAYLSSGQYQELEGSLAKLFGKPVLVTPSTSLGHLAAFQSLIKRDDLVVLDQQAHASLHAAAQYMKGAGVEIAMVRHSNLKKLETLLVDNPRRKVWYCFDGVYSMYGDWAPIEQLYQLADRYPNLMLYADDAHGFSWFGKYGLGAIRGRVHHHAQLILAVSLNKAFGCAGGALVFATQLQHQRVRTVGNALVFSGPIQPPMLGAAVASAKLHSSAEFALLQSELSGKIKMMEECIAHYGLPDLSYGSTPIFFIAIGSLDAGYAIIEKMIMAGYYLNLGLFPAVSIHRTGIRITINNHLKVADIESMVACLARVYREVCEQFSITESVLTKAFLQPLTTPLAAKLAHDELRVQVLKSIPYDWDRFSEADMPKTEVLQAIEQSMRGARVEDDWQLFYLRIYYGSQLVLQAAASCTFQKADMFMAKHISVKAEVHREHHPHAFCQKVLMLGTPVTEGRHFWVNHAHQQVNRAVDKLCEVLTDLKYELDCDSLVLRDFSDESAWAEQLQRNGFLEVDVHDRHEFRRPIDYQSAEYFRALGKKNRQHWQGTIGRYINCYQLAPQAVLTSSELDEFYQLYLAVQSRAREIATFTLPKTLFSHYNLLSHSEWLVGYYQGKLAFAVLCLNQSTQMQPIAIGMDYQLQEKGVYRIALHQIFSRAKELAVDTVQLGFGASFEKRRLGATAIKTTHFVKSDDQFDMQRLHLL